MANTNADEIWSLVEPKLKVYISERLALLKKLTYVGFAIVSFFTGIIVWMVADPDIRSHLVNKYVVNVPEELKKPEAATALDQYMRQTVAYSYSSQFTLGAGPGHPTYNVIPFYKTKDDRGKISCTAVYPSNLVKNVIIAQWNEYGAKHNLDFLEGTTSIAKFESTIPNDDDLFGKGHIKSDEQKITFRIEDSPPFGKLVQNVNVECTMLIVGPARYKGDL